MARKSQRLRRERRMSRLQQKLMDTGQLKVQPDNSVMIERMQEMDEIVETTSPNKLTDEQIEEMTKTVEMMIEEVKAPRILSPSEAKKLKKAELLEYAQSIGVKNVTMKNTKSQMLYAIEKLST